MSHAVSWQRPGRFDRQRDCPASAPVARCHQCPTNEKAIMATATEIYALRYATMTPRTPHMNFLQPDPHDAVAQDLDYFVWLIRTPGRDILVDTGFNAAEAQLRHRTLTRDPIDALALFGVE